MKEAKKKDIIKICWIESNTGSLKCAIGFLVKETGTQLTIASTKNMDGFSDINKINKDKIVTSLNLRDIDMK